MFDQLGLDVLDDCYDKDPALTQAMVRRPLDQRYQRQSCLELADVAQSRKFLSHKCCMLVIDEVWNGVVSSEKSIFHVLFLHLIQFTNHPVHSYSSPVSRFSANCYYTLYCICRCYWLSYVHFSWLASVVTNIWRLFASGCAHANSPHPAAHLLNPRLSTTINLSFNPSLSALPNRYCCILHVFVTSIAVFNSSVLLLFSLFLN